MQTFVLIMTLWGNDMGGHAFIHSIEFRSEQHCKYAAREWLASITRTSERRTAVCVPNN
jgi:hypothetical protein